MFKKLAGMVSAIVAAVLAVLPAHAQLFGFPFISSFAFPSSFSSVAVNSFTFSSTFSGFGLGFSPFFSPFGFGAFSPFWW